MKPSLKRICRRLPIPARWYEGQTAPGSILSRDPWIIYTTIAYPDPTAYMRSFAARLQGRPALFVIFMTWIFEPGRVAERVIREFRIFSQQHPHIQLLITVNQMSELELFQSYGLSGVLLNHNFSSSDQIYRPIQGMPRKFDAIYNARLTPFKRIELSADLESFACITGGCVSADEDYARQIVRQIESKSPQHCFTNAYRGLDFEYLNTQEVNQALNQAHVGLCLSEAEGAMFASVEYLLAGLPVVSTPNRGGRNHYAHPDFWLEVPATPKDVALGVANLKRRQIPPEWIREQTLKNLRSDRARFLKLLDEYDYSVAGGRWLKQLDEWPWAHRSNLSLSSKNWDAIA